MKKLILVLAVAFITAVVIRVIMQKTGATSPEVEEVDVQVIET